MELKDMLIPELRVESVTTRSMLERIPQGLLAWAPHAKSRSLGDLAAHMADLPGRFIARLTEDAYDAETKVTRHDCVSSLVAAFDDNVGAAQAVLSGMSDECLLARWTYRRGGQVVFEMPRLVVVRTSALNHLIHHRGQLSVYLRLLETAVPRVYGPTADAP